MDNSVLLLKARVRELAGLQGPWETTFKVCESGKPTLLITFDRSPPHPAFKSYIRLCLGLAWLGKGVASELLAKVKVKWFYADVRAASFISRPPPYHENSGPRSVQFGLGAAGGLQPAARYELETGNVRNQLLKTGKTETGKIETEKVQNRTDKLPDTD